MNRQDWLVPLSIVGIGAVVTLSDVRTKSAVVGRMVGWPCVAPAPDGPCIPSSITAAEAACLADLGRNGDVVEFGSAYGFSAIAMARAGARVTSVDPHHWWWASTLEGMRANLADYAVTDRVTIVQSMSQAWCASSPCTGCVDLVFIDGGHDCATALSDLRCAATHVRRGGHIALHDWVQMASVKAAAQEWTSRPPDSVVDKMAVWSVA